METLFVALIVGGACFYVGRNLYKQFKGTGGCSSGCSCSQEIKHQCNGMPDTLNNLK